MNKEDVQHLEKLMNFLAKNYLKKNHWSDVSKTEWTYIVDELNDAIEENAKEKKVSKISLLGKNYLYEHLIINKLKPFSEGKNHLNFSKPNLRKLSMIVQTLGYANYIDFINSHTEEFNFNDLRIDFNNAKPNIELLDQLVGYWYSYNRNLVDNPMQVQEERIWRSAIEIYKSETSGEFFLERSGGDRHRYYGKITAFADYVFIIMNSNTFIRQRHFISRIKDVKEKLKNPDYRIQEMHFISTCISFNQNPIALFEIFQRVSDRRNYVSDSISYPIESKEIPENIAVQLKDTDANRMYYY